MNDQIKELSTQLAHARNAEALARSQRIQTEEAIIAQLTDLKEKGSKTIDCENGLALTVTTGFTYKADLDGLANEDGTLACMLAKPQPDKLDEKVYENLLPEHMAIASRFVEVKPKKVSVALKVK